MPPQAPDNAAAPGMATGAVAEARTAEPPPAVVTGSYRLECAADRPFVYLSAPDGERIAELFVPSGVHSVGGRDDTTGIGRWQQKDLGDHLVLECEATSSVWQRKIYRFRCWEDRLGYEIEVEGEGAVSAVDYFGGYSSAILRWGSGFFWSKGAFGRAFNPEPSGEEQYRFDPRESSRIDTTGVPLAGSDGWFFTPPPFCFAFEYGAGASSGRGDEKQSSPDTGPAGRWLAAGIEARPGENLFNEFHYRTHRNGFHLSLPFEVPLQVRQRLVLPVMGLDFADDPYEALGKHVSSLRGQRLVKVPEVTPRPTWWSRPIFCGWGAQCDLARREGGSAPSHATQANYDRFLERLEEKELAPGTVVLDDKWQQSYGDNEVDVDKWPDLAGFVADQHARGRKVLLWLKAWDPEGVPAQECVRNAAGQPLAVDPTNPAFELRFRRAIRRMLGEDGYGADGFKLDFSARIPASPGVQMHDPSVWGLELMRRYLWILHDEAKNVKPDALIMTHTPHPYLADLVDMIRLNDINTGSDVVAAMTHRAKVARLACPEALVDTDNWPITDREAWRTYLEVQPTLGVVSLYFASHIDSTGEELTDEDYRLIRKAWEAEETDLASVGK